MTAILRRAPSPIQLKTLLALMTAVGVLLGSPPLVKRYAQFVEARPCSASERVVVKGRLIRFFGPKTLRYLLLIEDAKGEVRMVQRGCSRSWLFVYSFETKFDLGGYAPPPTGPGEDFTRWKYVAPEPGEYDVTLLRLLRWDEPTESEATTKLIVLPR